MHCLVACFGTVFSLRATRAVGLTRARCFTTPLLKDAACYAYLSALDLRLATTYRLVSAFNRLHRDGVFLWATSGKWALLGTALSDTIVQKLSVVPTHYGCEIALYQHRVQQSRERCRLGTQWACGVRRAQCSGYI